MYDETAHCPRFQSYLDEVLPEKELQNIAAEFFGYVFAKGLKMEKALLLYGSGANGKSVLFDVVNALLGKENISNFSLLRSARSFQLDSQWAKTANQE